MTARFEDYDDRVLIIVTDARQRFAAEEACRAAGVSVLAASSIAELEKWPEGQVVITDFAHLTPWWRRVGAAEVIVLVTNAAEGHSALSNGATNWLPLPVDPAAVLAFVTRARTGGRCKSGKAGCHSTDLPALP
jgi:hypothetical protein